MRFLFATTLLSALGCGLMAGFFFAFSVSVMKAAALAAAGLLTIGLCLTRNG